MAAHRVSLWLAIVLVEIMAGVSASAQTEVLRPISEETPPAVCWAGWFVSGIRCSGRYCDNVSLLCPLVNLRTIHCWQTRAVSEEHGGVLSFREGSSGGIVVATQMSCSGVSLR